MNAFGAMLSTLFNDPNLSIAIVYTPQSGAAVTARAALSQPDVDVSVLTARTRQHSRMIEVRGADVHCPKNGDGVRIGGESFTVTDVVQRDPSRLVFRLTLAPAS